MAKKIMSQTPKEVAPLLQYQRTKLDKMSMTDLQSSQLASFQIISGDVKQYIQYNVKETAKGLKCTREIFYYVRVPNRHKNARKSEVFVYMNEAMRKKRGLKKSSKVISLDEARDEINKLRKNISPDHRTGIRAY